MAYTLILLFPRLKTHDDYWWKLPNFKSGFLGFDLYVTLKCKRKRTIQINQRIPTSKYYFGTQKNRCGHWRKYIICQLPCTFLSNKLNKIFLLNALLEPFWQMDITQKANFWIYANKFYLKLISHILKQLPYIFWSNELEKYLFYMLCSSRLKNLGKPFVYPSRIYLGHVVKKSAFT